MQNIYGQDEETRNAIVRIPEGFAENAGNTLYAWLGSLWRDIHRGEGMVRGLQSARGIQLAQMYVDILEAVRLQDRFGAPVFHKELWHPIVIRKSRRDKAQENLLTIGEGDLKIGPQPAGSDYGEGTVFQMGKMAGFEQFVTYPIEAKIAGGAVSIVDNIVNPTVFMERGIDFEIRNNSIIFRKEHDPVGPDSAFDRFDLPDMIVGEDGTKYPDVETVLWASDVLIDRNYVADHLSYAIGSNAPSSDVVKRILNAAWSSIASGLTPELVKTLLAAMLNVPVIQRERETVIDILEEKDDDRLVARVIQTDCGTYRISPKAMIRNGIHIGSVLRRGELLDETVRIYPFLNVESNQADSFSVSLEQDVPSVVLAPEIIRARTEYGVYAMWKESDVKIDSVRAFDANGNPRLYFDVGGTDADVAAFWSDIWSNAEKSGVSMADILGVSVIDGQIEPSQISPARFILRNLVGANTLFVVVDKSQADDVSLIRDPMFFDILSDVVPSAMRIFIVEHDSVGDEDRMDMGTAAETEFLAAALPKVTDCQRKVGERVIMRMVRPSPVKIRSKKEEK